MLKFLTSQTGGEATAKAMLTWNRYKQKGWRGPYMEQDIRVKLDPDDAYAHYLPLIATSWADKCEKLAKQAEEAGDDEEAEKFRRGKYYLIVRDKRNEKNNYGKAPGFDNTARIVCFGADCEDSGSYYIDFIQDDPARRTTANDLRKPPIFDLDHDQYNEDSEFYDTGDDIVVFIFGGGAVRKPEH